MDWRMRCRFVALFFLLLILLLANVSVQAQLPTATLVGIVTDPQGAAVAGARVVATNKGTGIASETTSGTGGEYAIVNLPPGLYNVHVEAKGFAPRDFTDLRFEVGRNATLDVQLALAALGQKVVVSGGAAQVDLTESTVQNMVTSTTVENIPLNGRNFLELAFLLPGNRSATNYDPTKTNTLEVSSAGQFGRGGNLTVDGGDNNDEVVGGTLANFPEDGIQEFQIATNRYSAEVGRSASSIINIISKSGTNDYHGSGFIFVRNRNLQGLPATFSRSQPTPPFDRQHYGGSIGGPIRKEKAWFFFSYERRHQNAPEQTGFRDFSTAQVVPSSSVVPLREHLLVARVDYRITDKDLFFGRYSYNKSTQVGPTVLQESLATFGDFQDSLNRFNSVVGNWTHTFSPNKVNNLIYHFDKFLNSIPFFPGATTTTNPVIAALASHELDFPSLEDGPNYRSPQRTRLNRHQIRDTFAWTLGTHTLHFGGEFQNFGSDILFDLFGSDSIFLAENFGGDACRQAGAPVTMCDRNGDGVVNDLDIPISNVIANNATPGVLPTAPNDPNNYFAYYIQDDWRFRSNLTFNLGLRWDFDTDIFGTDDVRHAPCPTPLSTPPTKPCIWLRTALNLTNRSPDYKEFGPRLGFAWDPFKQGKTVVRGGYGLYFDRVVLEPKLLEELVDGRRLGLSNFAGSTCGGTLAGCSVPGARFDTGTPTLFAGPTFGGPLSGAAAPLGVGLNVFANGIAHPLVNQFTLGVQQQIGRDWLFSADGLVNRGTRFLIGRELRDSNNVPIRVTDPLTGIAHGVTFFHSQARVWYDGLLVSAQHRPTTRGPWKYGFNVNYTLSKSFNESNDDQIPFLVSSQADVRFNVNNLGLEKGYAPTDERHRLVFFGVFQVPLKINISPIWTLSSSIPGNPLVPGIGRLLNVPRNALAREIHNSAELNAAIDAWNALSVCPAPGPGVTVVLPCRVGGTLNHVAPGLTFGKIFNSWDMRVSRTFTFAERHNFELIGEAFNLFNVTNIRGFNNLDYFGFANDITLPNFNQALKTAGGFFGSGGPRAFQFALRYSF
jgi:carboxypeptidase family protein/TonB-dependent receptor-like protein